MSLGKHLSLWRHGPSWYPHPAVCQSIGGLGSAMVCGHCQTSTWQWVAGVSWWGLWAPCSPWWQDLAVFEYPIQPCMYQVLHKHMVTICLMAKSVLKCTNCHFSIYFDPIPDKKQLQEGRGHRGRKRKREGGGRKGRSHHGYMKPECMVMKVSLWSRSGLGGTWQVISQGYWQESKQNRIEDCYLPSSNALSLINIKVFLSFIWKLNDQRQSRNPDIILATQPCRYVWPQIPDQGLIVVDTYSMTIQYFAGTFWLLLNFVLKEETRNNVVLHYIFWWWFQQ